MNVFFEVIFQAFSILAGASSFFLLVSGLFVLWASRRAGSRFLRVQAKVVSKELTEGYVGVKDGHLLPGFGPGIEYEYEVDGQVLRCNIVMSVGAEMRSNRDWAERILRRHDVGQLVDAYYDPDNPSQAFLVNGDRSGAPYFLVTMGGGGLAGAGLLAQSIGHLTFCLVATAIVVVILAGWLTSGLRKDSSKTPD